MFWHSEFRLLVTFHYKEVYTIYKLKLCVFLQNFIFKKSSLWPSSESDCIRLRFWSYRLHCLNIILCNFRPLTFITTYITEKPLGQTQRNSEMMEKNNNDLYFMPLILNQTIFNILKYCNLFYGVLKSSSLIC